MTCVHLPHMLSPYFIFTGDSSRPPRKSTRRQRHTFTQDEEGRWVDDSKILQEAREEQRAAEAAKKRKAELRRRGKAPRPNYKTMDSVEYSTLRQQDWFETSERDSNIEDPNFWCLEQLFIYKDIYVPMKKPVRPMHPIDMDHLRTKTYFAEAVDVTEKLGLHHLMTLKCDYNVTLVQQFFATLVIKEDDGLTMRWMTGDRPCESNFFEFARVLGYDFDGPNPVGRRLHTSYLPEKDTLAGLYDASGILGTITGLLPLYDQLLRLFRENIAPSGGNNDAIRGDLVNLMAFTHECAINENPHKNFKIDVMNYIFHEMFDAMVSRTSIPYAPYVMMLIKDTLRDDPNLSDDCEEHKVKKPYVKRTKPAPYGADDTDSFMRDARASGSTRRAAAPPMMSEIKKLTWFQRNILCMKVEIHKEQYQAYRRDLARDHKQDLMLHKLSGELGPAPRATPPTAYNSWNVSRVNWPEFEKQLYTAPRQSSPPTADDSEGSAAYEQSTDEATS